MTRRTRLTSLVAFAALTLSLGATVAAIEPDARPAAAAGSRAVVNIGGSNRVISFGSTVTGLQALRMVASVTTVGFGFGEAVCSINGQGNPATQDECLVGPNGEYWSYWRAAPGASGWQYSSQGAGGTTVTDGAVEGWRYGTGGPPPFTSFCAVAGCAPPPPPPTAPPATAAPSVAGSSASAPGDAGGDAGPSSTTRPEGARTETGGEASGGSADASGDERAAGSDREEATGATARDGADGGGGSPVGVLAAGGIVAALAAGGVAFRRRRNQAVAPG